MRCKIGYWRTGMGVQLDEEAFGRLRASGPSLRVEVLSSRRIALLSAGAGRGSKLDRYYGDRNDNRKAIGFHGESVVRPEHQTMPGPDFRLPLFELHEVLLDYNYVLDALVTAPLANDHQLPWPRTKCARERLSAAELMEQCVLRVSSHMREGGHGYFDEVGVPVEVVRTMAGGYVDAVAKARRLVHGAQQGEAA